MPTHLQPGGEHIVEVGGSEAANEEGNQQKSRRLEDEPTARGDDRLAVLLESGTSVQQRVIRVCKDDCSYQTAPGEDKKSTLQRFIFFCVSLLCQRAQFGLGAFNHSS